MIRCRPCDQNFKNHIALEEHRLLKHGAYPDYAPHTDADDGVTAAIIGAGIAGLGGFSSDDSSIDTSTSTPSVDVPDTGGDFSGGGGDYGGGGASGDF
jgi:uncharacterized membrane protein YgcG